MKVSRPLILTTPQVDGRRVISTLGLVVASKPYPLNAYYWVKRLEDGSVRSKVEDELEAHMEALFDRLAVKAHLRGAHAVVGVRLQTRELSNSWREMLAYGTAVVLAE